MKAGARPAKPARRVIGALIIKHRLGLSDSETLAQLRENPYLHTSVASNASPRSGVRPHAVRQTARAFEPGALCRIRAGGDRPDGRYSDKVLADGAYGIRANRRWFKEHDISFGGKPLGYPTRLGVDRLRRADTHQAWIRMIFLVMNLIALAKVLFGLRFWDARAVPSGVAIVICVRRLATEACCSIALLFSLHRQRAVWSF